MRALGDRKTRAEAAKFKLHSRTGADPAQFRLPAAEGQAEMSALPALTEYPFDNRPKEFIGRNPDLFDLLTVLNQHRAAVVLGVSGVGKTELAKQTARRMVERRRIAPERVAFAALVNSRSADEARAEIARALGLKPGDTPDNGALQRAIPRHALVILDEAENVVQHDGLAFRRLLDALVAAPAKPMVIVTSQTDPIISHAPPVNVRRLSDLDGFRLFAANANLTEEQFARIDRQALIEVLGFLDRLPRAIELVARVWRRERGSNADSVDLTSLLAQLRADRDRVMRDPDYPDEVKSVTVGVQYAYDRLLARSPEAARVWTYLALFPGGLPKAGLASIFDSADTAAEIEKQSLVESAFGHLPPPFGDLLQLPTPFRFFALRHLPEGGEAAARAGIGEAVMRYYLDFEDEPHRGWAGILDGSLSGSGGAMGFFIRRFSAELPSVESWLDWAYDDEPCQHHRSRAARLTAQLRNIYTMTDVLLDQQPRFARALASARRCADNAGEANVLEALGDLQLREDDLAGARGSYESALPLYREIRARLGEANVLKALGDLQLREDDLAGARGSYESALPLYREIRARLGEANVLKALGDLQLREDDLAGARGSYESALPLYREIRDRLGEANVLASMGRLALSEGDETEADRLLGTAIALNQTIGERFNPALDSAKYGIALKEIGKTEKARPHLLRAAEMFVAIGFDDYANMCRAKAEENAEQEA